MGDVRRDVLTRDGAVCRLAGPDCSGVLEVHHVLPRGRSSRAVVDCAENAILACSLHHASIHAHPESSWALGLLAHQWDERGEFWQRLFEAGLAVEPVPSAGATDG